MKKIISILLSLALCLGMFPTWAFAAEGHTEKQDGDVASVTVGETTNYYTDLLTAWAAAKGKTATVTLLANVTISDPLYITAGDNITFDGGVYTLTTPGNIFAYSDSTQDNYGILTFVGGTVVSTESYVSGVKLNPGSTGGFIMTGGTFQAHTCINISSDSTATVKISGGTIISRHAAVTTNGGAAIGSLLDQSGASRVAFYKDGTLVTEGLDKTFLGSGTYTVQPCTHQFDANSHCPACDFQAVAKAEKNGTLLGYYDASGLDKALADNSGNDGAVFTLLNDVERDNTLYIRTTCTLDLNGHTIHNTSIYPCICISGTANVTIQGEGEVISEGGHALDASNTTTLKGGTFTSRGANSSGVYFNDWGGTLIVSGDVVIRNTVGNIGLQVTTAKSVQLSGGTYSGEYAAIWISSSGSSLTLAGLLTEGNAYHSGDTPIELQPDDKKLTGTVTVKACTHTGEGVCTYTHNENTSTHTKTCLACGYTETGDCGFEKTADPTADSHTGQCPNCKRDRSGAHSFSDWAGNPVARTCTVCGYEQTAVARVEKDGTTTYVGALADAFTDGNSGATVTLLSEVDLGSNYIGIRGSSTFTLDLNGQTVKASYSGAFDISGGSLTIQDSGTGGKIESSNITIEVTGGTLSIKSGTVSGDYGVKISSGTVNISGGTISGNYAGLWVYGGGSTTLSGGTFSGIHAILVDANVSVTLKDLLATGYAYHQNDIPIANATGWLDSGNSGDVPLDTNPAWLPGTVTVKECNHTGGLVPSENGYQHGGPCKCCGAELTAANHTLGADNQCSGCGAALAAKVEKSGSDTIYVEASGLEAAFAKNSGNDGATFTLLANVEPNTYLTIQINCILNLGGHTITGYIGSNQCVCVDKNTAVTILGEGEIIAPNGIALAVDGSVTLEGGTYTSTGSEDFSHGVQVSQSATLSVTGEKVTIRNTGGGSGLNVDDAQSVQLSAGTYSGAKAIESIVKLSDMLVHTDNTRYAYYQNDIPVTKASAWVDNNIGDVPLDTPIAWLSDTVTVKACNHAGEGVCTYTHNENTSTHTKTCLACGKTWDAEDCAYTFSGGTGTCAACGDSVTVTVSGTDGLIYDGTGKEPGVTVTRGETQLTAGTDYTVAYTDNTNAGTATVTVTIGGGAYTQDFTIGKATPTLAWESTTQELTYTGQSVAIEPTVTLVNDENFSGTITYTYGTYSGPDLPTNVGTYSIKASIAEQGNYTAAQSEEMTLTIKKANVTVTAPTAKTLTYTGSAQALVTAGTASVGDVVYSTAQDGTYTKNIPTGTNAGMYDVWYKVEGTDNYNGTAPAKVAVTINKASHEDVTVETSAKFGTSRTYDISGLLPDGAELGNITVSGGIFADPQPAVSEGVLSYTLAADQDNIDESGTVTVPVTSSTNYNAFNLIIKITVANVDIPELTVDAISVTYTGQPVSDLKISGTAVSNGTPVKGGWSFAPGQALTDVADSGLKEVIFTPEDSTSYGKAKGYAQVQIGKATPTLRLAASPTATTGGNVTFSLSGLPDGGTANLTCSDKDITVTKNQDGTFTANIPQGSIDTTYTFTAAYAGDSNHEKANTSCSVLRKALTELPDPPADDGSNKFKLVMEEGISEVPAGLKINASLDTPEELEAVMKTKVTEQAPTIPAANTAVYDVALLVSMDGGKNWTAATKDNFPAGGLTVTLPYPSGTDSSYTFTIVHMFTTNDFSKVIGGTETPAVTNTANGLRFTVTGLSPISVGWEKKTSQGGGSGGGGGWVSYYTIKVNDSEHGKVTADRTSIYAGGTVTLTVKPDEGYRLDKITVTDSQNKAVELTEKNGKYTFKMPSRDVTVKADFVPAGSPSPEPTGSPSPSPSGSPTPTTSPSPSPDSWNNPFPDVSNTGWYIKAIEYVCTNGLMAGYENGNFGPNDTLSRAQLAQIIYNKEGRPKADSGRFTDVTAGWYANAVNWAAAEGIVAGVGGGKFAPDQPISRQDLAVMLWRYAGSPEPRKNELDFIDAGKVSDYAWKALCWANENGIVSGKGNGILDPKGKATRAEAAQMLMNYSKK